MPHTDSSATDIRSTSAAWWAVISLALGAFGLVTAEFLPISLLTPMATELGTSNGTVGQTITATAVVAAFAGPLVVLGAGRLDRQKIVWGLMVVLVLSSILCACASTVTDLLIARGLLGFALGSFWAMMTALALRLVPPDKVPKAISIILMGISFATVFAAPLGGLSRRSVGLADDLSRRIRHRRGGAGDPDADPAQTAD